MMIRCNPCSSGTPLPSRQRPRRLNRRRRGGSTWTTRETQRQGHGRGWRSRGTPEQEKGKNWDEGYLLVTEEVDAVTKEIEKVKKENAELTEQIKEAAHRHEDIRLKMGSVKNGKSRSSVALSSQTDLSKMSSTGLKAYHTLSTKKQHKGTETPPPPKKRQPRVMEDAKLQIVFVSAEVAPYSKTGGLGDVVGSLPFAMAKRGHRVMIVTPRYLNGSTDHLYKGARDAHADVTLDMGHGGRQCVKYYVLRKDDVDLVFVDHPCFHRNGNAYGDATGTFKDNTYRFALLSMAACEAPLVVQCTDTTTQAHTLYGEDVLFMANDWHTALIPVYLESKYRPHGVFKHTSCILAIHNLAHQGIESPAMFHNLGVPESHYGVMEWVADDGYISMNLLKGGLVTADRIITVSCMHAFDMMTPRGAMGLHPVLQCRQDVMNGIINGIDVEEWNPETDTFITEQYSHADLSGKVKCKLSLQRELGFRTSSQTPLIGYVGRLDEQKGPDLVLDAVPWMMSNRCQVVMLGTGHAELEQRMKEAEHTYRGSFSGFAGFSVPWSHRIISACDIILMPSRFEPCGLTQQFAIRYGTIPVAHATGGLMDTIEDFNPFGEAMGTGFLFRKPDVDHLIRAIDRALDTFRYNKDGWQKLQLGMKKDFSWSRSAISYERVFRNCVQAKSDLVS